MAVIDKSGGLDYHFVEEPPDSLVCPVCLLPCREPHLISCCGKKACHSCISRVQQVDQPCPLCRTPEFATMIDREVERQVLSLKVYCNNKQDGCTWIGELRQLEGHSNVCLHVNLSCKYKCGLCCPQQQMLIHERDDCDLRPEIVLTKTIDELTKKIAELESTCKYQSLVIKRQQGINSVTNVGAQELDKEKADNQHDKLDDEFKQLQLKHDERIVEKNLAIKNLQESLESKETALNGLKHQETTMKRNIKELTFENGRLKRQIHDLQRHLGNHALPQPPPYNPVYTPPPQRLQPLPQRSEARSRVCPVCNLAYPIRLSQQEFERHVNSHFQ